MALIGLASLARMAFSGADLAPIGAQLLARAAEDPGEGLKVLVLVSPGDLAENNVLEFLLEESSVTLEMLYVSIDLPLPSPLPEHDLAFVAVCETDLNRPLLMHLEGVLAHWPHPIRHRLLRDGRARQ